MRLITKTLLGLALSLSLGAALTACGDDSGPEDLYFATDQTVIVPADLAKAPTDGGATGDLAQ